jgi:hypothetical protein
LDPAPFSFAIPCQVPTVAFVGANDYPIFNHGFVHNGSSCSKSLPEAGGDEVHEVHEVRHWPGNRTIKKSTHMETYVGISVAGGILVPKIAMADMWTGPPWTIMEIGQWLQFVAIREVLYVRNCCLPWPYLGGDLG